MTDRELLEAAATAAGWTGWQSKHGYWNVESPEGEKTTHCHNWDSYCPDTGQKLKPPTFADAIQETNWNPLYDDGDALRLAVKLELQITVWVIGCRVNNWDGSVRCIEESRTDICGATRRAIVRAAAEIGRARGQE